MLAPIGTKSGKRGRSSAGKVAPVPDAHAAIREASAKLGTDLSVAKKAIEDATGLARTLWISFLTFGTYLAITVAGVTHEALFKETPIKLPLLNTELPLVAFFWVAPILFLIFQLYLLLNLKLLADQVHHFGDLMKDAGVSEDNQDDARLQLPNFMIVQILGGHYKKRGVFAWFTLFLSTWMTLIGAPVVLMIFIQLQFLPYHSEPVTWVHRFILFLIFGLVWWFWLSIQRKISWLALSVPPLGTAFIIYMSWLVMTFPGEPHHGWRAQRLPSPMWMLGLSDVPTMHEALFGDRSSAETKVAGWFENRLVYSGFTTVDERQLAEIDMRALTVSNETRTLANVNESKMSKSFVRPGLFSIDLSNRRFEEADFDFIDLRRADLRGARMQRAGLSSALLQGATLSGASMQGATLVLANGQGAWLDGAMLQGANLYAASLQGAQLGGAFLQGAQLTFASLQGSQLDLARLHFASLINAKLQGASLNSTLLIGASLNGASLDGAALDWASLQGASFGDASLHGLSMENVTIWRTYVFPHAPLELTWFEPLGVTTFSEARRNEQRSQEFREWRNRIEVEALSGVPSNTAESILDRLKELDIDPKTEEQDNENRQFWDAVENNWQAKEDYIRERNERLGFFACAAAGAPYVARGIIRNFRLVTVNNDLNLTLINELLSHGCAGANGLAEFERQSLIDTRNQLGPLVFAPEAR